MIICMIDLTHHVAEWEGRNLHDLREGHVSWLTVIGSAHLYYYY